MLGIDEAVTGWAALRWMGAAWFDGTARTASHSARRAAAGPPAIELPRRALAVSQEFLHPDQITWSTAYR